ncbi:MAG: alpha/beta fold hydrolase, partial [Halobacteriaceae archaeon]
MTQSKSESQQPGDELGCAGIDGYVPEFISVDGINTRYYDVGSGEPLVLVHGGNWSGHASANRWTRSFEHLANEFRVIAFDRIGCGLTDNPSDTDDY